MLLSGGATGDIPSPPVREGKVLPGPAVTSPIGRGCSRARQDPRGSNLPYRAGLLPRPAATLVPAGPGLLPVPAVTPHYVTVGRSNTQHFEASRKRGGVRVSPRKLCRDLKMV